MGHVIIHKKFAESDCQILEIDYLYLTKSKPIHEFDCKIIQTFSYAFYHIIYVRKYNKSQTFLATIQLDHSSIIRSHPCMKKHDVLLDMINNSSFFSLGCYLHPEASSIPVLIMAIVKTRIIFILI